MRWLFVAFITDRDLCFSDGNNTIQFLTLYIAYCFLSTAVIHGPLCEENPTFVRLVLKATCRRMFAYMRVVCATVNVSQLRLV